MGPAHDFEQETIELLRRNPQATRKANKKVNNADGNSASNPEVPVPRPAHHISSPPGPQQGQTPTDGTSGQRTTRPPQKQLQESAVLADALGQVRRTTPMVKAVQSRVGALPIASSSQHPATSGVDVTGYKPQQYFQQRTVSVFNDPAAITRPQPVVTSRDDKLNDEPAIKRRVPRDRSKKTEPSE